MKKQNLIRLVAISMIILAGILVLVILLRGETTTSDQAPAVVRGSSLVCESKEIAYPIFTYDSSNDKKLKITIGFYDDKINAISLTYELYYDNSQQITASEAQNHAAMNIDFGKHNLYADSYNANYAKMNDRMRMALYASSSEINSGAARYFMIDTVDGAMPVSLDDYRNNYEAQGLVCKVNNN